MATFSNIDLPPKQLAQVRPASNVAASAVLKRPMTTLSISSVVVVNTTSGAATYSIFLDQDGSTYDQTTALYYNTALAANTTITIELNLPFPRHRSNSGNFAVQSNTANALTFTINGFEY